jgi:hypothetical protein
VSQSAPAPAARSAVPAPAPAGAAVPVSAPVPAPQPAGRTVVDTPALLNRWQLIGVSVAIVFGIVCALLQFLGWQADGRAADDTEQLVRIQEIQSTLLHADALATNAFLVGGLEDPAQREEYDESIASVLRNIADAAEAQPADRAALGALVVQINDYANALSQARVNNRQGFPVGAEYLSGASATMRADALPILQNLVTANSERAEDAMGGQHPVWLLLLGVLALAALWWINRNLAQAFRRRFNIGLVVAAVIILVTTLIASAAAYRGDAQNEALLDDELHVAMDQANARTAANDAKAYESLRLIKRGSGDTFEDPWRAAAEVVEENADPDTLGDWSTYVDRHTRLVGLDDSDRWQLAVDVATVEGDTGTTTPFEQFDSASADIVDENGTKTTDTLRGGRPLALAFSGLTLLLGVVAAIAVARGIGARRREYA